MKIKSYDVRLSTDSTARDGQTFTDIHNTVALGPLILRN